MGFNISILSFACRKDINPTRDFRLSPQSSWELRNDLEVSISGHAFFYPIPLTLNTLTWKIWWAPNNASRWQMGFNSAFKRLTLVTLISMLSPIFFTSPRKFRAFQKHLIIFQPNNFDGNVEELYRVGQKEPDDF